MAVDVCTKCLVSKGGARHELMTGCKPSGPCAYCGRWDTQWKKDSQNPIGWEDVKVKSYRSDPRMTKQQAQILDVMRKDMSQYYTKRWDDFANGLAKTAGAAQETGNSGLACLDGQLSWPAPAAAGLAD